jgi:hypothetical protein
MQGFSPPHPPPLTNNGTNVAGSNPELAEKEEITVAQSANTAPSGRRQIRVQRCRGGVWRPVADAGEEAASCRRHHGARSRR